MKAVYWRPQKLSVKTLVVVGALSVCGVALLEALPVTRHQPLAAQKRAAAQVAEQALTLLAEQVPAAHAERNRRRHQHPLLGAAMTPLTSRSAEAQAKHRAFDPNYAAAVVEWLHEAGVRPGDTVAIGWSGSFPGLNVAVAAAVQTLEATPVVVTSVMASQFGANQPDYTWLDMERLLRENQVLRVSSAAATLGGPADRGRGMSRESRALARAAIVRSGVPQLTAKRLAGSIEERMSLYRKNSPTNPITAYINVGGGVASCGGSAGKVQFRQGLNREVVAASGSAAGSSAPPEAVDCVALRFLRQGVPVIHLSDTSAIARQCGMPLEEMGTTAAVGTGPLYASIGPSRGGALLLLSTILTALHCLIRTGVTRFGWGRETPSTAPAAGLRLLSGDRESDAGLEQMV